MQKIGRRPMLGAALGLIASGSDAILLDLIGVTMTLGDTDVMIPAVSLFAATACALGAAVGWLLDSREQIRTQSQHIASQLDALKAAQRALAQEEALAGVGRLAAGVAHEVRNPLGVIRASAGLLAADVPPGSDSEEAARFIEAEVDRLDDFITRLLDLSRPLDPQRAPTSAREVAQQAAALTPDLDIDLLDDHTVTLDPALTARALAALLRNAAEAGASHVALRCLPDGFEVADDGPGFAPAHAEPDLFSPFFTTRAQGTGLGLAMVKKLVEVQGGHARLTDRGLPNSAGATGACICLTFPQELAP